jgi:hypothetical protein
LEGDADEEFVFIVSKEEWEGDCRYYSIYDHTTALNNNNKIER